MRIKICAAGVYLRPAINAVAVFLMLRCRLPRGGRLKRYDGRKYCFFKLLNFSGRFGNQIGNGLGLRRQRSVAGFQLDDFFALMRLAIIF